MNRRSILCMSWMAAVVLPALLLNCCSGRRLTLRGDVILQDEANKTISLFGKRIFLVDTGISEDLKKRFRWWEPGLFNLSGRTDGDSQSGIRPWNLSLQMSAEEQKRLDQRMKELAGMPDELIVVSFLADSNCENEVNLNDWCKFWADSYGESAMNNREEEDFYLLVTRFLQESSELLNIGIEKSEQLTQYYRMMRRYSLARESDKLTDELKKYAMSASIRAEEYQRMAQEYKDKAGQDKMWRTHFERLSLAVDANIDVTNFLNMAQLDGRTAEQLSRAARNSGEVRNVLDLQSWIASVRNDLRAPFQSHIISETTINRDNSFVFESIPGGSYFIIIPSLMKGNRRSLLVSRVSRGGADTRQLCDSSHVFEAKKWGALQILLSPFFEDPVKKIAAGEQSLTIIDELLTKNPDFICFRDHAGRTALHYALMKGRVDVAELLLAKGADVNAKTVNGESPLHFAVNRALSNMADSTALNMVESLISAGARVNEKDIDGVTPLHRAVYSRSYLSLAKTLAKHGATIDETDENGETPLHYAVRGGHREIVKFLIESGADIELKDNDGETPMDIAELYTRSSISRLLFEKRKERETARITTELLKAIEDRDMKRVKAQLAGNPQLFNCGNREKGGETPLHAASAQGDLDIVKLLVSMGAKLDAKDLNGLTPLNYAEKAGEMKVVEYLREKGAKE